MSAGFISKERVSEAISAKLASLVPLIEDAAKKQRERFAKERLDRRIPPGVGLAVEDWECLWPMQEQETRLKKLARMTALATGDILLSEDDMLFIFGL